ncbi:MAG: FeoA family protein [Candidatus Caldatribacteriota bacterium]|nr:FeoA family protein [Candidatus Caldatribacteriota bacterium]
MVMTLDKVKENQKVKVVNISGGWGVRQRLGCLGIHPGDIITIMRSAIMQGPILIKIHGNQVALGRGVASRVFVEVM